VQPFVTPPPVTGLNWFDAFVVAVLLLFGWRGFRRGALSWLAGLGASLLALAAAFALAPVVTPLLVSHSSFVGVIAERLTFVALLFAFRFLLGWAVRELVASIRPVLRLMRPLDLMDRLLGILPSLALGCVLVLAVLAVALLVPVDRRLHETASRSYVGRLATLETVHAAEALTHGDLYSAPAQILDLQRGVGALQALNSKGIVP
jgi:uncharacterized membrane protein required for colicin V production